MPYLNEDDLVALHKQIDDAEHKLTETTEELKTTTETLNKHEESITKNKKNTLIQNIVLSVITGIALALAYYFYSSGSSSININEIKQNEANRVIDSMSNVRLDELANTDEINGSIEETTAAIKSNLKGQKIYSVQIGAFTKNRYTLLSETIAGISSNEKLFKYSIGLFETLKEAQNFRKELVKIGFRDAFVASYIDGVRQEIEQPN